MRPLHPCFASQTADVPTRDFLGARSQYCGGRRWPDGQPRHRARNETAYGDPMTRGGRAAPGERSYYLHWIRKDLEPWASAGGITRVRKDACNTAVSVPSVGCFASHYLQPSRHHEGT